jgi:hypothetical protein
VFLPQRRRGAEKNLSKKRLFSAPLRLCGKKRLGTEHGNHSMLILPEESEPDHMRERIAPRRSP